MTCSEFLIYRVPLLSWVIDSLVVYGDLFVYLDCQGGHLTDVSGNMEEVGNAY